MAKTDPSGGPIHYPTSLTVCHRPQVLGMRAASLSPSVPNLHGDESEDATVSCICSLCSTQPRSHAASNRQPQQSARGLDKATGGRHVVGMWWDAWVNSAARRHWLAQRLRGWVPCAPSSCTLAAPPVRLSHPPLYAQGVAGRVAAFTSPSPPASQSPQPKSAPCLSSRPSSSDYPTT